MQLSFQELKPLTTLSPERNSLGQCSGPGPSTGSGSYPYYNLQVRFINISSEPIGTLEALAQEQIDGACQVWWDKGRLNIVPGPPPPPAGNPTVTEAYETMLGLDGTYAASQETFIREKITEKINSSDLDRVRICFVDTMENLNNNRVSGYTFSCASSGSFVFLEVGHARNNKYLLAHELGHVLGLRHPDGSGCENVSINGSYCSVMVPDLPNSSRNTVNNLSILDSPPSLGGNPMGGQQKLSAFSSGPNPDGNDPDLKDQGFFRIIRDFPYDEGTEPSVLEAPFTDWWSHSSVWNSEKAPHQFFSRQYDDGSDMFNENYSPIHSEPTYFGPRNMYVQLHTCQPITSPVNVYLYLAVPGSSTYSLQPLINSNPHLEFTSTTPGSVPSTLPTPGTPKTMFISWEIPAGLPSNCCVFAVATSTNEDPPNQIQSVIANPAGHNFYSLFSILLSSNDVAQRNLHFQSTSSGRSAAAWSTVLPWVEMANPQEDAQQASIEVDTRQAADLESLSLVMGQDEIRKITLGGKETIQLVERLDINDDPLTLRFKANLLPNKELGSSSHINLQMFIGNELISGYQHIVRVESLSNIAFQVLDLLYGSLLAVNAAFESPLALDLVKQIKQILINLRRRSALCDLWNLLVNRNRKRFPFRNWLTRLNYALKQGAILALFPWIIEKFAKHPQWLSGLVSIKNEFETLGKGIQEQVISTNIQAIYDILSSPDTMTPNELIEKIREYADFIQEVASRIARQT